MIQIIKIKMDRLEINSSGFQSLTDPGFSFHQVKINFVAPSPLARDHI
jgi:hypothetical protein